MKLGNTPKCITCHWYREKESNDDCQHDGWCRNPKALAVGVNGRKRMKPPEKEAVKHMWSCKHWEDAETRLTHYEVTTRQPEEWRTPIEQMQIQEMLK